MSLLFGESERSANALMPVAEILLRAKTSDSVVKSLVDRGAIELEQMEISREQVMTEPLEDADFESTAEKLADLARMAALMGKKG